MSNIYDSANELSRGLRELPEYKAVKTAKDAIKLMNKLARFLQTTSLSSKKSKSWRKQDKCQTPLSKKRCSLSANKSRERSFVRFLCQTATIVHLPFRH